MGEINVRKALPEDAEAICILQQKTWIDTYESKADGVTRSDLERHTDSWATQSNIRSYVRMIVELHQNWLVAEYNGSLVGHMRVLYKDNNIAYIDMLYVLPAYQHKGVGGALMGESLKEEQREILVDVVDYNSNAIRFYANNGFTSIGIERNSARPLPSGKVLRLIRMRKRPRLISGR